MQLYRRIAFGRLAEFSVLDTRQYRTDQPCGDGTKPPCEGRIDPQATLLGQQQENWLLDGLARSPATWNVLAQQVMMARVDQAPDETESYSMDQWPGYEANRRRILKFFAERKIANPVVLTGDIHTNWANDLVVDFDDLGGRRPSVGAEFVGTSISSGGDGTAKSRNHDTRAGREPVRQVPQRASAATSAAPSRRASGRPTTRSSSTSPGPARRWSRGPRSSSKPASLASSRPE